MTSTTDFLYNSKPEALKRATETHEFVVTASENKLPDAVLALWLAQDKVYASLGYPKFVGALLAALPEAPFLPGADRIAKENATKAKNMLIFSLENIVKEVHLKKGLVFLWAMEKVYLDTWTKIHESLVQKGAPDSALLRFAYNWSTPEFVKFVDEIADHVNTFIPLSNVGGYIYIWERVLEIEVEFWPSLKEAGDK
ncbi:heme oxygenase-like protein [Flagelloscypha sp. PMI_526]|nr:heme oxygenase-like protein [Flagelloscypha sp. PMI_526]